MIGSSVMLVLVCGPDSDDVHSPEYHPVFVECLLYCDFRHSKLAIHALEYDQTLQHM